MTSFADELRSFEGLEVGEPVVARDEVNMAMIRHWCDAIGDTLPVYTDVESATASIHGGVIAPPTMLQAWTMWGFRPRPTTGGTKQDELIRLLADHGFTSVVATNCEQEYIRELRLHETVSAASVIESVSDEKKTALGNGHFVTLRVDCRVDAELVATQRWTMLLFEPSAPASSAPIKQPSRPRPSLTLDNAWWFEALRSHRLLIQRCVACGTLRHPPRPMCDQCRDLVWNTVEACGDGTIFSFVVNHHPKAPGFEYPLPIGLIELAEGTRLVAEIVVDDPASISIGLPVSVDFVDHDEELTLPVFRIEA